jgi:hypothetical protein
MDGTRNELLEDACACAALRRAARATSQFYDLVLQPSGWKATQFFALKSICEAGEVAQGARAETTSPNSPQLHALLRLCESALETAQKAERLRATNTALPHETEVDRLPEPSRPDSVQV